MIIFIYRLGFIAKMSISCGSGGILKHFRDLRLKTPMVASIGVKMVQTGSKRAPRGAQGGPRAAQEGPKMAPGCV